MALSDAEVADCKDVFGVFDMRNAGNVDSSEVGAMLNALGLQPTHKMIEKITGISPKEKGKKTFSVEEFMPMYKEQSKNKDTGCFEDFMEAFNVYDKLSNGEILSGEVEHLLLSMGDKLNNAEVKEIMRKCATIDDEDSMKYEDFIKKIMEGPFPEENAA